MNIIFSLPFDLQVLGSISSVITYIIYVFHLGIECFDDIF